MVDTSNYWEVDYCDRPYGLFLLLLFVLCSEQALYKTIQRLFEIANGLIRLTMLHCSCDTVFDMLFQDSFAHLVKPGAHRRNLCQHIVALALLFPQPFEAVSMTSDAREPFSDILA